MADMEATNEIGWTYLYATTTPQNLPARVFGPAAGPQAELTCRPRHAYMTVEGGDVRYRVDGTDVDEPFGLLALDGSAIDWTDPQRDFSSFIDRMSVIATNGADSVLINVSWRS